ncbi:type III-A CRISPR-associated RAMP protein Csm5 [Desulfatibacillum aliphaticivorans]|uniref:type III-A CRISPR-associated RAMP protein Csm5 n=1 Tax=Desulfatibacillum aliphaticivorans TaxID=218208 RepID=UPI000402A170|nr:type III-A CRISPR-associated RAMP protein Csm5 [Desulfatibacillum aliphaticivorans]
MNGLQFEKHRAEFELLTPVHIGTGEELDPFSYVIRDGSLHFIDLVKWMESYEDQETLLRMTDTDNFAVLRSFVAENVSIEKAGMGSVKVESHKLLKTYEKAIKERDPQNQVLVGPMMRNFVTGQAYIPGSSVKGAIRTALANPCVGPARVRKGDRDASEKIFGRIKDDPMRWLKIPDISLGPDATVIVEPVEVSNKPDKSPTPKGHVEAAHALATGRPNKRSAVLSLAPFPLHGNTVDAQYLLDALNDFYVHKYVQEALRFYNAGPVARVGKILEPVNCIVKNLASNEAILRVGRFSHVECMTLDDVRAPKTRMKNGRPMPFGTTRTLANQLFPFGWIKVRFPALPLKDKKPYPWPNNLAASENAPVQKLSAAAAPGQAGASPQAPTKTGEAAKSAMSRIPPTQVKETSRLEPLLKQLTLLKPNDKVGMDRMIDALERLSEVQDKTALGNAIIAKLKKAGMWKKHPRKLDVLSNMDD